MFGARRILGLAFEDGAVRIAELHCGGQRPEVVRAAEFIPPADAGIDQPAKLGAALGEFLAREGFAAKRAVLGLPASWLMSRECSIPPAAGDLLVGILRIQAERAFSSAPGELAVDCVDRLDRDQTRPVLIVAVLRSRLGQAVAAAEGARLKVKGVTATSLAIAAADGGASEAVVLLRGAPGGPELTVLAGAQPRLLRKVAEDSAAEQVWRALALLPQDAWWTSAKIVRVVDGQGADRVWAEVGERLGVPVQVAAPAAPDGAPGCGSAVAMAQAALAPAGPPVDFLHTHLAPHRKTHNGRKMRWAVALGVTALIALVAFVYDWRVQAAQVVERGEWLAAMQDDIAAAEHLIETTASARGWYDRRPAFLDCLRELTLAFPERGTVWTTSLRVKENMEGSVVGKAADERSALQVLDRLKATRALSDVKLLYLREAEGGAREVAFGMSFTYLGTE